MRMFGPALGAALLTLASLGAAAAATSGDPARGGRLAEQWCSSCHLVSPTQKTAGEAPPFATIAKRSPDEIAALAGFLADPHPPMPNLSLTREDIRDLLAYIASLK